jgi:phosphatidylserine/phosphatidylglycerophosphate/cardiolipin synthase-like enzyme
MRSEERYSGSDSYKFVDRMIKEGGSELLVVSPYIDNYYTRVLMRTSRHRRVRVITSPEALLYRNSLLRSIRSTHLKGYAEAAGYFTALSLIVLALRFYYIDVPIIAITAISYALMIRAFRSRAIRLKVIKDKFVHEKIYISNGTAVTGSANLTYSGMHKNIEHVEKTHDAKYVDALRRHFEELWASE